MQNENNMKLGKAIGSGIIGLVWSLIAIWFVFGILKVPLVMTNIYFAVGIAGFFSSFFAIFLLGKRSVKDFYKSE